MIKIICNHCGASADIDESHQGKFKQIEELTGMVMVPQRPFLSYGPKAYCQECADLITEGARKKAAKTG